VEVVVVTGEIILAQEVVVLVVIAQAQLKTLLLVLHIQ